MAVNRTFQVHAPSYAGAFMSEQITDFRGADVRIRAYGQRAYLLEGLCETSRGRIEHQLECAPPLGYEEAVPGSDHLMVLFKRPTACAVLRNWLEPLLRGGSPAAPRGRSHEVPVVYDGPDLQAVAQATGLSAARVVELHAGPQYRVRMIGFTPGFPYLDGLDPRLHLPRKASPRERIAPGAVAIGGSHAGIYSVASPGGWHCLGRTALALFQPQRARGALCAPRAIFALAAGDRVKFKPVSA